MSEPQQPTPITVAPRVPKRGDLDFNEAGFAFTNWQAASVPQISALGQVTFQNAVLSAEKAVEAQQAEAGAQGYMQQAAQHAESAQAAIANVLTWASGGNYEQNVLVWGTAAPYLGTVYRATVAHNGVATPPQSDIAHWAPVGANWAADPEMGRTQSTPSAWDSAGNVTAVSFMKDGKPGTDTYTITNGLVTQVVTVWNGSTWTTTHTWNGVQWTGATTVRS